MLPLLLLTVLPTQANDARPVSWEALPSLTAEVWQTGPGAAPRLEAEGWDAAARRPQRGPSAIWAEVQRGLPEQDQLTVALDVPLRFGVAETRAGERRAEATRARACADQTAWAASVRVTWLEGWAARENSLHLAEYIDELGTWLAPLEAAAGDGLVASLDVADLKVEQARVFAEKAASDEAAAAADARLSTLLGQAVQVDPEDEALHTARPTGTNPWAALLQQMPPQPAVAAARADAAATEAERRQAWAEALPTASIGGMTVQGPDGTTPLLFAGMTLPLRTDGAARRAELRARTAAATADARWLHARERARAEAEALRWDAALHRMQALDQQLIEPLRARQRQTLAAVQAGLAPTSRLVLARRDLHEAEHEQIRVLVSLLASEARAAARLAAPDAPGASRCLSDASSSP